METMHRKQARPRTAQPIFGASAVVFGWPPGAMVQCGPKDSALTCHMRSFLTVLDTVAAFLVILLALVVLFAVYAYRSKPDKLVPQKDRPDD